MPKYLKKTITETTTGNQAEAFIAIELIANLETGEAYIKEAGYKTAQLLADGAEKCIRPILWYEPDITLLTTLMEYPPGTGIEAIIFDVIGYRMQTLENLPDGTAPNPFKGCTFEEIPGPSA